MIIIKTNMTKLPNTCKECELRTIGNGVIMCGVKKDWIELWEYKSGKVKLDNCPLEEKK